MRDQKGLAIYKTYIQTAKKIPFLPKLGWAPAITDDESFNIKLLVGIDTNYQGKDVEEYYKHWTNSRNVDISKFGTNKKWLHVTVYIIRFIQLFNTLGLKKETPVDIQRDWEQP